MEKLKIKKYYGFPTYKRINSILSKGWKLVSVNSVLCREQNIVLVENKMINSFSFEKCDGECYCLQRFLYYSLWSEDDYTKAMQEIQEYQEQGAYIISTWHIDKTDIIKDDFQNDDKEAVVSKLFGDGRELLYYIILPKKKVKKQDKEKSYDAMLKFLGFDIYAIVNIDWLMSWLPFFLALGNIFGGVGGDGIIHFLSLIYIGIFVLGHCLNVRSYYYYFRYRLYRKEYSVQQFLRERKKKKREVELG